jgi:predicted nucleic acid-binding protein
VASEVTRFELLAGVRKGELQALEAFSSSLASAPIDEGISRTAGTLAQRLRRSHRGIDDADHFAATAMVLQADLLTTNVRRFPMIDGLQAPH